MRLKTNDIMNYNSDIKELHQMVSNFYRNFPKNNFLHYSNRIKELIQKNKELITNKDSIFKTISLFDKNFENNKLIIKEVIGNNYHFFFSLNQWLMNHRIDHLYYESIAYFTAGLMRCSIHVFMLEKKELFIED